MNLSTQELLHLQLSAELEATIGDGSLPETPYLIELRARIGADHRSVAALAEAAKEQELISNEEFGEIKTGLRIQSITNRALRRLRSQE